MHLVTLRTDGFQSVQLCAQLMFYYTICLYAVSKSVFLCLTCKYSKCVLGSEHFQNTGNLQLDTALECLMCRQIALLTRHSRNVFYVDTMLSQPLCDSKLPSVFPSLLPLSPPPVFILVFYWQRRSSTSGCLRTPAPHYSSLAV